MLHGGEGDAERRGMLKAVLELKSMFKRISRDGFAPEGVEPNHSARAFILCSLRGVPGGVGSSTGKCPMIGIACFTLQERRQKLP